MHKAANNCYETGSLKECFYQLSNYASEWPLIPIHFAKIHLNPLFCEQYHQPYFNQINALWEQKKIHT
jgi:hypothetical protein